MRACTLHVSELPSETTATRSQATRSQCLPTFTNTLTTMPVDPLTIVAVKALYAKCEGALPSVAMVKHLPTCTINTQDLSEISLLNQVAVRIVYVKNKSPESNHAPTHTPCVECKNGDYRERTVALQPFFSTSWRPRAAPLAGSSE